MPFSKLDCYAILTKMYLNRSRIVFAFSFMYGLYECISFDNQAVLVASNVPDLTIVLVRINLVQLPDFVRLNR